MAPEVVFFNTFTVFGHWQSVTFTKKIRLCRDSPTISQDTLNFENNFYEAWKITHRSKVPCSGLRGNKTVQLRHRRDLALQPLLHNDEKVFVRKGSKQKHKNTKNPVRRTEIC
jgi:hypothetical protein